MSGLLHRRAFFTSLAYGGALASLAKAAEPEQVLYLRRGTANPGDEISLPAIAARSLPESLGIGRLPSGIAVRATAGFREALPMARYLELRKYRCGDWSRLNTVLTRARLQTLLLNEDGMFVFGFRSLETRERAWRELSARPDWQALGAGLEDLAIYRTPA